MSQFSPVAYWLGIGDKAVPPLSICFQLTIFMYLFIELSFFFFCLNILAPINQRSKSHGATLFSARICNRGHFYWCAKSWYAFYFSWSFQWGKYKQIPDLKHLLNKLSINWCQTEPLTLHLSSDSLACQQGLICLMHCHNLWGLDDAHCWLSSSWLLTAYQHVENSILVWRVLRPKNECVNQDGEMIKNKQQRISHLSYH